MYIYIYIYLVLVVTVSIPSHITIKTLVISSSVVRCNYSRYDYIMIMIMIMIIIIAGGQDDKSWVPPIQVSILAWLVSFPFEINWNIRMDHLEGTNDDNRHPHPIPVSNWYKTLQVVLLELLELK